MKLKKRLSWILGLLVVTVLQYGSLQAAPKRIISTAPALTEVVFALGKGDQLVGNTKFCNYPEAAKNVPRIGGLMDVNVEVAISKRPDIVLLYPEIYEKLKVLEKKARLVVVKHSTLTDVMEGIRVISKALEVEERGTRLVENMKQGLNRLRQKSLGKKILKTLLIIGRSPNTLSNMYIIGAKDFLSELLEVAGGVNAYSGGINYPSISVESVVAMSPDVIIELSAFNEGITDDQVIKLWNKFPFIPAVKSKKITIIKDSVWLIPGPRVVQIAEKMQRIFFGPGSTVSTD
ncbi:MAG: ABC transporter substrate-binding protein [bacterium]|nr:ABC transporter substrate-binding protein [bacterium]